MFVQFLRNQDKTGSKHREDSSGKRVHNQESYSQTAWYMFKENEIKINKFKEEIIELVETWRQFLTQEKSSLEENMIFETDYKLSKIKREKRMR